MTKGWAQLSGSLTSHYVALNCISGCGKYVAICGKKGWVEQFADSNVPQCAYCVHSLELGIEFGTGSGLVDTPGLPPEQIQAINWPILHLGTPPTYADGGSLTVDGLCKSPLINLTLDGLSFLPTKALVADMHCIMRWTMKNLTWGGYLMTDLLERVQPTSDYVMVHADPNDYTTNLQVSDLKQGILATHVNGKPIPSEHGGPLRLVIPHLYAWKSAKWVRRIEFVAEDKPGTWEQRGLHNRGDVWKEERFAKHDNG